MDQDEVEMLIRAILAAQKGPYSIGELQKEFYDLNEMSIPFKQFGFDSVVSYLQSEPDKFRVTKDTFTNQFQVTAVIDEGLASLRRLVSGQKSTKKKKTAKKPMYKPLYNTYKPTNHYTMQKKSSYTSSSYKNYSTYNSTSSKKPASSYYTSHSQVSDITNSGSAKVISSMFYDKFETSDFRRQEVKATPSITSLTRLASVSTTDLDSLWISNASYFLKEHMVYITHVAQCDKIFLRLIECEFSYEFEKMSELMNDFYDSKGVSYKLKDIDMNVICVVFDRTYSEFFRAEIKVLNKQKRSVLCYYLDEGMEREVDINDLYAIDEEFLQLKFQAIQVQLDKFDKFYKSQYLKALIEKIFCQRKFLCKRVQTNPLIISLYDVKNENESITELFAKEQEHFMLEKLETDTVFSALITFVDETQQLIYIQTEKKEFFEELMLKANEFYEHLSPASYSELSKQSMAKIKNEEYRSKNFFCAKYHADSVWYRVKFVRDIDPENISVFFVDYGNKESVCLKNIMIIPQEFVVYANLPLQAFPVSFMVNTVELNTLKEFWYNDEHIELKLLRYNSAGIPTVELVNAIKTKVVENVRKTREPILARKPHDISNVSDDGFDVIVLPPNGNGSNGQASRKEQDIDVQKKIEQNLKSKSSSQETFNLLQNYFNIKSIQESQTQLKLNQLKSSIEKKIQSNLLSNKSPLLSKNILTKSAETLSKEPASLTSQLFQPLSQIKKNENKLKMIYDSTESDILFKINNLTISDEEQNKIVHVKVKDLESTEMPLNAFVYITNAINPSKFILNPEVKRSEYRALVESMNIFYKANSVEKFICTQPQVDELYVYRNQMGECRRVKFVSLLLPGTAKVYDVDRGLFDAVKTCYILHITKRFTKLKLLAIKAELANVKGDQQDQNNNEWSEQAIDYFNRLIQDMKCFSCHMKSFNVARETYEVDLLDQNGSLSTQMINKGFAKKRRDGSNS